MNRMSYREYIMLLSESLVKSYGDTILEWNTDLEMARDIIEKLKPFLFFKEEVIDKKKFLYWRNNLLKENGFEEITDQAYEDSWKNFKLFKFKPQENIKDNNTVSFLMDMQNV